MSCVSVQTPHPRLVSSHVSERVRRLTAGVSIDWATAEACAIGTLLLQGSDTTHTHKHIHMHTHTHTLGYNVRLSGQDVGRGTFSHRHVMIVDQNTEEAYIPLNHISAEQSGFLEVNIPTLRKRCPLYVSLN